MIKLKEPHIYVWFKTSLHSLRNNKFYKLQIREVRRAVLLNCGTQDDYDSDTEWENPESLMDTVNMAGIMSRPESVTTEIDEYPGKHSFKWFV